MLVVPMAALVPALSATRPVRSSSGDRELTEKDLSTLSWRSVGPANMGGRVSAIALVPGSRTSFYVGFGTGGVFKTDNLGVTFSPVFDKSPLLSIGAIAVADAPTSWPGWAEERRKADSATPPVETPGSGTDKTDPGKGKIIW